jgi:hypothetical protein
VRDRDQVHDHPFRPVSYSPSIVCEPDHIFVTFVRLAACGEFYEVSESIGQQPLSSKPTKPMYHFSHGARFDDRQAQREMAAAPGPGSYRRVGGTGVQVDSTMRSQPIAGFSRSARFRVSALEPRPELNAGRLPPTAVGRQVLSERRSKPQFGFGSARRFNRPATTAGTPGPGSYNA